MLCMGNQIDILCCFFFINPVIFKHKHKEALFEQKKLKKEMLLNRGAKKDNRIQEAISPRGFFLFLFLRGAAFKNPFAKDI